MARHWMLNKDNARPTSAELSVSVAVKSHAILFKASALPNISFKELWESFAQE